MQDIPTKLWQALPDMWLCLGPVISPRNSGQCSIQNVVRVNLTLPKGRPLLKLHLILIRKEMTENFFCVSTAHCIKSDHKPKQGNMIIQSFQPTYFKILPLDCESFLAQTTALFSDLCCFGKKKMRANSSDWECCEYMMMNVTFSRAPFSLMSLVSLER